MSVFTCLLKTWVTAGVDKLCLLLVMIISNRVAEKRWQLAKHRKYVHPMAKCSQLILLHNTPCGLTTTFKHPWSLRMIRLWSWLRDIISQTLPFFWVKHWERLETRLRITSFVKSYHIIIIQGVGATFTHPHSFYPKRVVSSGTLHEHLLAPSSSLS